MHLFDQLFRRWEHPLWFESEHGREGAFNAVALSEGKRIPVVGTKIAREGLAFVSNVEVRGTDVPLTLTEAEIRSPAETLRLTLTDAFGTSSYQAE